MDYTVTKVPCAAQEEIATLQTSVLVTLDMEIITANIHTALVFSQPIQTFAQSTVHVFRLIHVYVSQPMQETIANMLFVTTYLGELMLFARLWVIA